MTTGEMAKVGREIMGGKGPCLSCHTVGQAGAGRFPDWAGSVSERGPVKRAMTDIDYFAENALRAERDSSSPVGSRRSPPINKPPIGLTDQEILA